MHFTVTRSINPICNCKSASLTKEGLLTSFNSKLYLTDLETMSNKLIATLDSDISNSYLIDGNLFISCKNSIFINNLKINFHKKIFFFNVINDFLVVSFHNSTYIFKYRMHKIHIPYFNCKIESPIVLDYNFIDNEKINDYLEIVCKYDFVTLSSCYNDKLILGDVNGKLHFINLETKKILSEDKSDFGIKLVDFFKNDLFILDEKNNLIKNNKVIKKNVIGFSVKEEKLVIGKEYKLVDHESKKNICEFRSRLVYFDKNVGITDEFEILVEERLLVGNNDEITDLCFVKNSENKQPSSFEAENFKNKKMCIKQNEQDSLVIATNSGRLRIFENGMYKLYYDQEDSILSLAKNDDFLFTCSRDESLCVYFQGNLILKVTDINLLSIVMINDDLFGVGGTNIFHFKIISNKNMTNFSQVSFTKINDTFLKLIKSESVNKEINYLTSNNKFLSICFDKQINVYDHKLNLLQSKSLNKKINVIAMSDKYLFSGNKTFRVHNINTLEVLYSLEINVPLVSMCVYNENVLLGDANGWLYSVKDDKILFKKQIHKDRIWCIKQIQSNNKNFLVTGSADGSINFLINDTEEYNERKTEEERINKQIKLDIKVLRDNKDYPTLLEKMITNNLPGIEKELLNYFYTNNKSLDKNTINLLKNTTLNHKKMNLKYLELINYLSNQINLQIKDSLIEGMDELFKELIKNKN